jgi:hypothetical protein
MSWTVESNAPWLTVSVTDDGVPGKLTATANPAGLAENESHSATVTVTADFPGDEPDQVITIPAVLAIGDVRTTYQPPAAQWRLYLPAIMR